MKRGSELDSIYVPTYGQNSKRDQYPRRARRSQQPPAFDAAIEGSRTDFGIARHPESVPVFSVYPRRARPKAHCRPRPLIDRKKDFHSGGQSLLENIPTPDLLCASTQPASAVVLSRHATAKT